MLTLNCIDSVFCDGLLTAPDGRLLFMSVWGRDTTISEFVARVTLSDHPDGIKQFEASGPELEMRAFINDVKFLDKRQARASNSLFGDLVQLFVFDQSLCRPDRSLREAWTIYRTNGDSHALPDPWPLVMDTCHVPLMPHWRKPILQAFEDRHWISRISGYQVGAIGVHLGSEDLEACIEDLVKQRAITLKP